MAVFLRKNPGFLIVAVHGIGNLDDQDAQVQ